jgi:hypothetical protein
MINVLILREYISAYENLGSLGWAEQREGAPTRQWGARPLKVEIPVSRDAKPLKR